MQQRTREEKEELVQLYKQSGMSVRAFAQEFDLNFGTFRNWIYKKHPESMNADDNRGFVEVNPTKARQCTGSQSIRIQKAGMEIYIPATLELSVLEKILGAVKAI